MGGYEISSLYLEMAEAPAAVPPLAFIASYEGPLPSSLYDEPTAHFIGYLAD